MKVLKILFLLLVLAVVAVVGAVAAFLAFSDPNDFKPVLAQRVRDATGRELTLDGPLSWGFWPKLRLEAGPVSLSNAAGFGAAPFLAATKIQVAVATLPLLKDRIEMDTIVLHGVRVNLARRADGSTNWDDLTGGDPADDGGSGLAALVLGGIDIQDAEVTWSDESTAQTVKLSKITVATGALTYGEPIAFKLALTANANKPLLDSDIVLDGTVNYNVDDEHYVVKPMTLTALLRGEHLPGGSAEVKLGAAVDVDLAAATATLSGLEFSGLGTTVAGEFTARDIEDEQPSVAGTLALAGRDIAQVFNAFQMPVGKQLAQVTDRTFNFDVAFDANMDSGVVTVSRLDGKLLGAQLSGGLEASKANTDEPVAKGHLNASGPDLPTLVAVIGTLNGASSGALKSLNTAFAGAADKSFTFDADLDVDLGAGRAALPKLEARLLGNTVSGELVATNAASDDRAVKGTLEASGPDLPSMLAVLSGFQADGKALRDMAKSLAAEKDKRFDIDTNFDADMQTGRIDVPALSAELLGLTVRGSMQGQKVDFAKGSGNLDGRLTVASKDLGPLLRGLGQGDMAKSVKTLDIDAGIKGSLAALDLSPLTLTATVVSPELGKPVELAVAVGSAQANLAQETLSLKDVSVTGLGLNAKANVEAQKIKSDPTYSGTLDVPAFNLRNLLATLNKPVPKTADPKALTSLGLHSRFNGTSKGLALEDLEVQLDQTRIEGQVNVASFAGPALEFGLGIDSLNADRYLEPKPAGEARATTPEAVAAGAASELPVETLRALTLKGDLTIGDLVLSGAKMKNIKVSVNAKGGMIKAEPLAAELYGGRYGGAITLNATGKEAQLSSTTQLVDVNVETLLKDTVQNESLSGIVSFDAALAATGGSAERIKRTLGGNGRFGTKNGVFRGVDALAVLQAVERIIECKCPVPVPQGGETRFNSLGGTLVAANGVIRNEDLVLAGDGFTITGKGMLANLHDNSLKYDLELAVTEQRKQAGTAEFNLGGYEVPIQCRGNIEKPSCLPDFGGILAQVAKRAAKKEIEKAVGDKLKDVLPGETGDALKKLFKF